MKDLTKDQRIALFSKSFYKWGQRAFGPSPHGKAYEFWSRSLLLGPLSPLSLSKISSGEFRSNIQEGSLMLDLKKEKSLQIKKKNRKKNYTSYSKLSEVRLLTVGLASPLRILQWAEKTLPNGKIYGEVLNANTLHHKTFKPQKGGLFCERIFGPLKDFECACGKIDKTLKQPDAFSKRLRIDSREKKSLIDKKSEYPNEILDSKRNSWISNSKQESIQTGNIKKIRKFCPDCDVEYTWSVIRRYQLGYIKLISPVTHIWFLKGTPSYLSLLLDMKKRHLQFITYCSEILTLENSISSFSKRNSGFHDFALDSPSKIFASWQKVIQKTKQETTVDSRNQTDFSFFSKKNLEKDKKQEKKNKRPFKKAVSQKEWVLNQSLFLKQLYSNVFDNSNKSGSRILPNQNIKHLKKGREILNTNLTNSIKESPNSILQIIFDQHPKKLESGHSYSFIPLNFLFFLNTLQLSFYYYYHSISLKKDFYSFKTLKKEAPFFFKKTQTLSRFLQEHEKGKKHIITLTPFLKKLNKKLPIDFFILYSIAQIIHQKSYILAIKKTWKTLFKQAYTKALLKAFFISNKTRNFLTSKVLRDGLGTFGQEVSTLDPFFNLNRPLRKLTLEEIRSNSATTYYYQNQQTVLDLKKMRYEKKELSKKHRTFLVLNRIRKRYQNHILFAFKRYKTSFFSIFKKKDLSLISSTHFSTELIIDKFSSEIQNYLTFQTDFLVQKITKAFLKSFLFLKYLEQNQNYLLLSKKSLLKTRTSNFDLKECFKWYLESKSQESFKNIQNIILNNTSVDSYLNGKKDTFDIETQKKYFSNYWDHKTIIDMNLNRVCLLSEQMHLSSNSKLIIRDSIPYSDFHKTKRENSLYRKDQRAKTLGWPGNSKAGSFQPGQNLSLKGLTKGHLFYDKEQSPLSHTMLNFKQRLFNNIYTLSYRERWDNEKDWQVFLLYNSATVEYMDFPIFAYKQRFGFVSTTVNSWNWKEPVSDKSQSFHVARTSSGQLVNLKTKQWMRGSKASSNIEIERFYEDLVLSNAFYSGPGILKLLLDEFNLLEIQKLDKQNRLLLYQLNKTIFNLKNQVQFFVYDKTLQIELKELCQKRDLLIRRTKLVRKLFRKDSNPSSMILTVLPVLPPDLRPIVKMGNQIAASDLNRLYQRVIYRNERLKKFLKDPATSHSYEMKYAQRLLQEAVDNLIQNGKSGIHSEKDSRGRILKSLSDNLKGKQGRFRQFLLGKRVDYSGRSVIVVGPKLKLHECGIPIEMAKELYLPFLLKRILNKNYAKTVVGAKTLMKNNPSLEKELLREIMQVSPVLLNRAPTLHRLGIQAFVPKLVEGRAILLHPLVCSAFNADFDGDQMAVHVPITIEARTEAWKLMLARNNILSPATGDPLAIPSQDMVLGCYYLTTSSNSGALRFLNGTGLFFQNFQDVIKAYQQQQLDIHALIWVQWKGLVENGMDQEEPVEIRFSRDGNWNEISANYHRRYDSNNLLVSQYIVTTPGRILWNLMIHRII